jgi:hypothetical protein
MITPTARSITFPRAANSRNSFPIDILMLLAFSFQLSAFSYQLSAISETSGQGDLPRRTVCES